MILGKVIANVVSTEKHPHYTGYKLLMVQPIDAHKKPSGKPVLVVDTLQAGEGDLVLVVEEGGSVRKVLNNENAVTIRSAVCGIVDTIDLEKEI